MLKNYIDFITERSHEQDIEKPLKSFAVKKELNPLIWETDDKIKPIIREKLLGIAEDFYKTFELGIEYTDIILTGSNCNFTWSEYSDIDLHILLDFSKVNSDVTLVQNYLLSVTREFNTIHDIKILDYDVELYMQDINAEHDSTGIYSLLNDKWILKPHPKNVKIDDVLIKIKAESIMDTVDDIEADINTLDYAEFRERIKDIWDKIKKGRQAGLRAEGEYSVENLVFKLLRRNGYIDKIFDLKNKAYDKHYSLKKD
jgi:hypothetical protein